MISTRLIDCAIVGNYEISAFGNYVHKMTTIIESAAYSCPFVSLNKETLTQLTVLLF